MNVVALPEFIGIFSKSNSVSTWKGRTYFLAREPSRKRKLSVIEVDCKSIEETKDQIKQLEERIEEQETIIAKQQKTQDLLMEDKEKLVKLYQAGYIISNGEPKYEFE